MSYPKRLWAIAVLAILGIINSLIQVYHFFSLRSGLSGFRSFCNFGNFDCDQIAMSAFAAIGPWPIAAFAAGWFTAILLIVWIGRDVYWRMEATRFLTFFSAVGSLICLLYLSVMIWALHAFCIQCLITDASQFLIFFLFWSLKNPSLKTQPLNHKQWKTLGLILGFTVVLTALFSSWTFESKEMDLSKFREKIPEVLEARVENLAVTDNMPRLGMVKPQNPPVTIVEYSDFQCPHCRWAAHTMHSVLKRFPTQVQVIFKNFPLDPSCNRSVTHSLHAYACLAAKTALCAQKAGHFEGVYEDLFDQQANLDENRIKEIYVTHGGSREQLEACLSSAEIQSLLSNDIEEAISLGIQGTPTFFINGKRLPGALPPTIWIELIEKILKGS